MLYVHKSQGGIYDLYNPFEGRGSGTAVREYYTMVGARFCLDKLIFAP
jgi:hypothetical protein